MTDRAAQRIEEIGERPLLDKYYALDELVMESCPILQRIVMKSCPILQRIVAAQSKTDEHAGALGRSQRGESWASILWSGLGYVGQQLRDFFASIGAIGAFLFRGWLFRSAEEVNEELSTLDLPAHPNFCCPITQSLLQKPKLVRGYIYEEDAILHYIAVNPEPVCLQSRQPIGTLDVVDPPDDFVALLKEYRHQLYAADKKSV